MSLSFCWELEMVDEGKSFSLYPFFVRGKEEEEEEEEEEEDCYNALRNC